jgi:hypothetical protein
MTHLFACFLVLAEEVIEDGPVLLVDPLHLVDVLGHALHPDQGLNQVLLLVRVGSGQRFELQQLFYSSYILCKTLKID